MISPELLNILCCPESHQRLSYLDFAHVQQLNTKIATGKLSNRGENIVTDAIDGALIREDGKLVYPIRRNIPVLLINEAIPV